MRRRIGTCLLAALMLAALLVPALAAGDGAGITMHKSDIKVKCDVSVLPAGNAAKDDLKAITADANDFYADGVQLKISNIKTDAADYHLILALEGDSKNPVGGENSNIKYIDQNGTPSFVVYPSDMKEGQTYHVYLSTNKVAQTEVLSFVYSAAKTEPAFLLGDVNDDGDVDLSDAIQILRYDAGLIELEGNALLAGDVNDDGETDISDAILILRYDAGLIEEF